MVGNGDASRRAHGISDHRFDRVPAVAVSVHVEVAEYRPGTALAARLPAARISSSRSNSAGMNGRSNAA